MKVFFPAFAIVTLISCKKSTLPTTPTIAYKINGQQVQISGGRDTTHIDLNWSGAYYGCYAIKPSGSNIYTITGDNETNGVLMEISTSGILSETTYNTGAAEFLFKIAGAGYGVNNGDIVNITISRYSNGTIDGTFTGTVSDTSGNRKTITEGLLSYIKVNP